MIGGWATNVSHCKSGESNKPQSRSTCASKSVYDPPSTIRIGSDYATVTLAKGAKIEDCAESCCNDQRCRAFSFNTFADGAAPICKHKSRAVPPSANNSCPIVNGEHNCLSGAPPARPPACDGRNWPKSCGPTMPGPSHDCCGPKSASWNANTGCGIAMARAPAVNGPWTVHPLIIENQWDSDNVYCTHTNPSPFYLPNGSIVLAFNAGFCNGELETIGTAISHGGWAGPWNLLSRNAIIHNKDGSPHHCEARREAPNSASMRPSLTIPSRTLSSGRASVAGISWYTTSKDHSENLHMLTASMDSHGSSVKPHRTTAPSVSPMVLTSRQAAAAIALRSR